MSYVNKVQSFEKVKFISLDNLAFNCSFIFVFKGNKGAVSMRLSIYGCSVCFVNAHLSAHDNQLKDRVDDYNTILSDQEFHVTEHKEIFFHEYAIK